MKVPSIFFAAILITTASTAVCQGASEQVVCETGPLVRNYGGGEWYVYSCTDNKSLVVVASPDNPAAKPFAFAVSEEDGVVQLNSGDRKGAVEITFKELQKLNKADIENFISQTKIINK